MTTPKTDKASGNEAGPVDLSAAIKNVQGTQAKHTGFLSGLKDSVDDIIAGFKGSDDRADAHVATLITALQKVEASPVTPLYIAGVVVVGIFIGYVLANIF